MAQGETARTEADRKFRVGIARALGGAVIFSLPLLMTMEMWWLGFTLDRFRIVLLILFILPVLIVLDRFSGFMSTSSWREDALDGLIAFGVGTVVATVVLPLFAVIEPGMPLQEVVGKIALQAVPGSFGAVLANSQLSADAQQQRQERQEERQGGYPATLFFMIVGAVFLAFNVAPTEEIVLLAARMTPVHGVLLMLLTLVMMHAFVYASGFRGSPEPAPGTTAFALFFRFTLVGYALALLVSAYVLWTFGRLGDSAPQAVAMHIVVLGFPAGLGAAAARLVL